MYNRLLDAFIAVADTGSFSKAAEKLYISNTAIMKQMNLLEKQLGLTLLQRSNQGIQLTKSGESIYKDALTMIEFSDEALKRAIKYEKKETYMLRVGTSFLNPCKVIMDLWAKVNSIYPQFKIQIVPFDDDHKNILSVINSLGQQFDIIAGTCSSSKWLTRCKYYELEQYYFCCSVSRNHPLASKKELHLTDLAGETLMIGKRGDSIPVDSLRDFIEKEHPKIKIEDTSYFYDMDVFNRCERSHNILLSLPQWEEIHPGLVTIPVDWTFTNSFGILYAKHPTKDVTKFLNALERLKQ